MHDEYKYLNELKEDEIMTLISTFNNSVFTYVDYEDQSLLGKEIVYDEDLMTSELISFLKVI